MSQSVHFAIYPHFLHITKDECPRLLRNIIACSPRSTVCLSACISAARCIAKKKGLPFSILGGETLANNIHSRCGLYFMDLDLGQPAGEEDFTNVYQEREERLYAFTFLSIFLVFQRTVCVVEFDFAALLKHFPEIFVLHHIHSLSIRRVSMRGAQQSAQTHIGLFFQVLYVVT